MHKYRKNSTALISLIALILLFTNCRREQSLTTKWEYNSPKNGGFQVSPYLEQETGPGLVFIQGGTFTMGRTEQDVPFEWNNIPRRVTVPSFYMDQTEVRNLDYLEYLYWLKRVFGTDYPEVVKKALPDTLVWRDKLAYNDPLVLYYLRHPSYREYPVVGVSWTKAANFCAWRTDRVNEYILIREGVLKWDPNQTNEENFNTDAYLSGQYEGMVKNDLIDLNPTGTGTRKVRMEDGILLPNYRLPTEAEWEFAALGLIGNTLYERVIERRIYPWNGHILRTDAKRNLGDFVGNFKRGSGDYMGVAGNLNDGADKTCQVYSYWPNDYGLYGMGGNVSEWVMDVFRPLSFEDFTDLNPFRGNVFMTQRRDAEGNIEQKDSLGRIIWDTVSVVDNLNRRNYRYADNRNYLDGDLESSVYFLENRERNAEDLMYLSNPEDKRIGSMLNNNSMTFKGASWRDMPYWASPGTRRFLDKDLSTDFLGFRCAMTRVGSPIKKTR